MPVQVEFVEHVQDILKVIPKETLTDYECHVTVLVRKSGKNQEPWKLLIMYQGSLPGVKKYTVPRGAPEWQKRIADDLTIVRAQPVPTLIAGFPPSVQEGAASAIAMMRVGAAKRD